MWINSSCLSFFRQMHLNVWPKPARTGHLQEGGSDSLALTVTNVAPSEQQRTLVGEAC